MKWGVRHISIWGCSEVLLLFFEDAKPKDCYALNKFKVGGNHSNRCCKTISKVLSVYIRVPKWCCKGRGALSLLEKRSLQMVRGPETWEIFLKTLEIGGGPRAVMKHLHNLALAVCRQSRHSNPVELLELESWRSASLHHVEAKDGSV